MSGNVGGCTGIITEDERRDCDDEFGETDDSERLTYPSASTESWWMCNCNDTRSQVGNCVNCPNAQHPVLNAQSFDK